MNEAIALIGNTIKSEFSDLTDLGEMVVVGSTGSESLILAFNQCGFALCSGKDPISIKKLRQPIACEGALRD